MKDSGCGVNAKDGLAYALQESRREGPLLVGPSDFRTEGTLDLMSSHHLDISPSSTS